MPNIDTPSLTETERTPKGKPRDEHLFEAGPLRVDLKGRSVRGGAVTLVAQGSKLAIQIASLVVLGGGKRADPAEPQAQGVGM